MKSSRIVLILLLAAVVAGLSWQVFVRLDTLMEKPQRKGKEARSVPVVTAPIETAPIAHERAFSGTLEADAEFVAAPKVGGIIESLSVDLGDSVMPGQVIARLDSAEFVQVVAQAQAELEVARANLGEANSLLKIAERELTRINNLSERGLSSASQQDVVKADQLAKQAHVQVTLAQVSLAESHLETARIRLGYTQVIADWHGDKEQRIVAERYVDEGENVTANTPLLKIVKLRPITAVIYVTEKDYAGLQNSQQVSLVTDAYPGQVFSGVIKRIAPVFREATRQARVEVSVDNTEQALKPGMFVRAKVLLAEVSDATVVPLQALVRRDGEDGVFVLSSDGGSVIWRIVKLGIRQDERVQVTGEGLQGDVVILGQQSLNDGSAVLLTTHQTP